MTQASSVNLPIRSGTLPKPTEVRMVRSSSTAWAPARAASSAESPFAKSLAAVAAANFPNGQVAITMGSATGSSQ